MGKTPSKKVTLSTEKVTTGVQQQVTKKIKQPKKCTKHSKGAGAKDKSTKNSFMIPMQQLPYEYTSPEPSTTLGLSYSSRATSISSDLDFKLIQKQLDSTHRVVCSLNDKFDIYKGTLQSHSVDERLLNAETLKQEKLATAQAEERLRTSAIHNDQLASTLNLQRYNDQRERIKHELKMKQQMEEVDAEAYRISKLNEAKASDPLLKENEAHKRKLEEMRAQTDCQIALMRATSGCNVNAAIMNNCVSNNNSNNQSVYAEEDLDESVHTE